MRAPGGATRPRTRASDAATVPAALPQEIVIDRTRPDGVAGSSSWTVPAYLVRAAQWHQWAWLSATRNGRTAKMSLRALPGYAAMALLDFLVGMAMPRHMP